MASSQAGQDGADGKLFAGVRFVLAGFDEPSELEFLTELERNGGQNMGRYSAGCTHVIVCDLTLDEPICVAALKDGKELVTEYWVADCLQFGTLMDTDTVLYRPLKDLNGIPGSEKLVLCLTGYQGQMRTDIMRMVDMMGARFTKPLLAAEVTHLICYKFEGEKFQLANRLNIKLVNHRWLEDCLLAWKVLPEIGYQRSGFELEFGNVVANDSEENGTPESTFRTASKTPRGGPGSNDATTTTPKNPDKQGTREKTPRSCPSTKSRRMVSPGSRIQMLQSSRKGKQLNFQSSHTPMRGLSVAEHQTTPTAHSTPMQPSSSKGQALVSGIGTLETCGVHHDENKTPQMHGFEVREQASGAVDGAAEPRDVGAGLDINGNSKTDGSEKVLLQVNERSLSSFNAQTVSTACTAIKVDEADCQNGASEQRPDHGITSNRDALGKVIVNNHIQELKDGNGDRCSREVENTSLQGAVRSPGTGKCEMGADCGQQGRTVQTATSTRDSPIAPLAASERLEVNAGVGPASLEKSVVLKAEIRTYKAQAVEEIRKEPGELDELRQKSSADGLIHSESNTQMIEETALAVLKSFGKSGISKAGDSPDDMEILQESRQLNQIIASTSMLSAGKRKLSDSLPVSNAEDLSRDQLVAQETKTAVRRDLTSELQADLQGDENTPSPWRTKKAKLDPVFASPVPGVLEPNSTLDSGKLQKSSAKPKYAGLIRKLLGSESVKRRSDFYDLEKEFCDDIGQGVTTPETNRAHRLSASGVQSVNNEEVPQEALPGQGPAKQPPIPGNSGLQSALKKKADQVTVTVTPLKRPFGSLAKTQSNKASPAGVTKTPKLVGVQKTRDTKTVKRPVLQNNGHGDPETKADNLELPKFPQLLPGVRNDVGDKTTHQGTVGVLAGEDSQQSSGPNEWTCLFAGNPPSNPLVKDADIPAVNDQRMGKINQCGLGENVPQGGPGASMAEERLQTIDRLGEAQIETTTTPKVKLRQTKQKATTRRSKGVEAVQLGLEASMPAAICETGRSSRQPRLNKEPVKDVPEAVIEDHHSEEGLQSSMDRLGEASIETIVTPKVKVRQKKQKATTRRSKEVEAVQLGLEAPMPAAVCETGRSSRQPCMNKVSVKDVPEAVIEDDHSVPASEEKVAEPKCSMKDTERWFALAGRTKEKDRFKSILKKLGGKLSKDGHKWNDQSTHVILPAPLRRTEKFFAGAAAGRWLLTADYLEASMEAKMFVKELDYEWHGAGYNGEGNIGLDAPRKWRKHREETGCGAFHGLRIVVYGECTAPTVDTLKRAIKAGGGRLLAIAPPYGPDLSGVDFALLNRSISAEDKWVKAFVDSGIACVAVDYLIDYVCKPSASLEKHILHGTSRAVADARKLLDSNIAAAAKRFQACQVPGSGTREQEVKEQELKDPPSEVHQGEEVSEEGDDVFCSVCKKGDREDVMMLCGDDKGRGCGVAMHIYCCKPPLSEVPEEDWFCKKCLKPPRKPRRVNK